MKNNLNLLKAQLLMEAADILNEKATRAEYRKRRTRKDFDYDKKSGTIKIPNGERIKYDDGNSKNVNIDYNGTQIPIQRFTSSANTPTEKKIIVDKDFFGLKRDQRKAMLGHEIVHSNAQLKDHPMTSKKTSREILRGLLKQSGVAVNVNDLSDKEIDDAYKENAGITISK